MRCFKEGKAGLPAPTIQMQRGKTNDRNRTKYNQTWITNQSNKLTIYNDIIINRFPTYLQMRCNICRANITAPCFFTNACVYIGACELAFHVIMYMYV